MIVVLWLISAFVVAFLVTLITVGRFSFCALEGGIVYACIAVLATSTKIFSAGMDFFSVCVAVGLYSFSILFFMGGIAAGEFMIEDNGGAGISETRQAIGNAILGGVSGAGLWFLFWLMSDYHPPLDLAHAWPALAFGGIGFCAALLARSKTAFGVFRRLMR